jgi:peptidoglycan hydrolase-like protein with peptidoglycan-binding domain
MAEIGSHRACGSVSVCSASSAEGGGEGAAPRGVKTPTQYHLPDRIWIARWDGEANTSTSYIRDDGWRPGGRMKQYVGGHDERYGGVTINIDRNYLSLGRPRAPAESHCGGVPVDLPDYPRVTDTSDPGTVKALQCLLTEQKAYAGRLTGTLNPATLAAMSAWQQGHDLRVRSSWSRRAWMSLLAAGTQPVLKTGSTGPAVRDLQRTLNAATPGTDLAVTGLFTSRTGTALRRWQKAVSRTTSGVANPGTWAALASGLRP